MSLNTTPRTWVNPLVVTDAHLNTEIRDALIGLQAAWVSYTPTLTGITLGNGSVVASYYQQGKTIHMRLRFTAGSSSTFSGTFNVTLPVTAASTYALNDAIGAGSLDQAAAPTSSRTAATAAIASTTNLFLIAAGTVTATAPWTWTTGDTFSLTATYEAA